MLGLPDEAMKVLVLFAPMFTQPVWCHVQELVAGAILCRGPRTVAGVLRTLGLADEKGFCKYHRVLTVLAPSERADEAAGRRHKTTARWTVQAVKQVSRWLGAAAFTSGAANPSKAPACRA